MMKASSGRVQSLFCLSFLTLLMFKLFKSWTHWLAQLLCCKKRGFFFTYTPKRVCFAYGLHLILYAREEIVLVGHCLVQQYQVYENISQKAFSEVNEMVKHKTTLFFRLCPGPVSNLIRCSSFAWGFAHGNQAHQAQPLRIDCEKLSE